MSNLHNIVFSPIFQGFAPMKATTANPASALSESPQTAEPLSATPEFLAELQRESQRLESATPQEIIRWAVNRSGGGTKSGSRQKAKSRKRPATSMTDS